MKNLFKLAGVLAMAGVLSSCDNAKKTMADYRIVPLPQEITQSTDGSFELNRSVKIIYPENNEAMRRNAG
ncbi:hypothetical protein, partial [Bacteroides heparinolyticus]